VSFEEEYSNLANMAPQLIPPIIHKSSDYVAAAFEGMDFLMIYPVWMSRSRLFEDFASYGEALYLAEQQGISIDSSTLRYGFRSGERWLTPFCSSRKGSSFGEVRGRWADIAIDLYSFVNIRTPLKLQLLKTTEPYPRPKAAVANAFFVLVHSEKHDWPTVLSAFRRICGLSLRPRSRTRKSK
jgi:hypothetical protein